MKRARPFVYAAVILLLLSLVVNFYLYFNGAGGVVQGDSIFGLDQNNLNNVPLLGTYPPSWNENSSGFIFGYYVVNYGNVEAKNVQVSCNIYNSSNGSRTIHSYYDYAGNISARSDVYRESIFPVYEGYNRSQSGGAACIVTGCSNNCEVLYKRVPELAKIFG